MRYQAGVSEADSARFLNYVEASVRQALPSVPSGWSSVERAAAALEAVPVPPLLVVVDDAHTLFSTAAEAALEQLVTYLPREAHLVLAGRHPPAFDLPRWRLARQIVEIGPDELRFRSWEVEELFAQHYGVRLVPDEVAELAPAGRAAGRRGCLCSTWLQPIGQCQNAERCSRQCRAGSWTLGTT